jgi:Ca2+-binding EF-hand superfamily protein
MTLIEYKVQKRNIPLRIIYNKHDSHSQSLTLGRLDKAFDMPQNLREVKSPREQLQEKNVRQIRQSLRELQHNTHFGQLEISDLYEKYVTKLGEGNKMTPELFKEAIAELLQIENNYEELTDRYYNLFDVDSNGNIDFIEFVTGASILLKGSPSEKIKFIFSCYDLDNDGYLTVTEMKHWLGILFSKSSQLLQESCALLNVPYAQISLNKSDDVIEKIANVCFEQADNDHDGKVTFEEFSQWTQKQPEISALLAPGLSTPHSPRVSPRNSPNKEK